MISIRVSTVWPSITTRSSTRSPVTTNTRAVPATVRTAVAGTSNAGADAREEIESAALTYVADRAGRETLTHHLKMAQLASDPRTARVAGRLSAVITSSAETD